MLYSFFPWWFHKKIPTAHNGQMRLVRSFGRWEIFGQDGTEQGSRYMDALWKKVLRRMAAEGVRPKRVLLLGVALGGTYHLLLKRWPDVRIVGVDWEPELLRLATHVGAWKDDPRVETRFGDALDAVPTLAGSFDLIIVDLFNGKKVADATRDPRLAEACAKAASVGASVCVNYFSEPDATGAWDARFVRLDDVRYSSNGIAVYRKA